MAKTRSTTEDSTNAEGMRAALQEGLSRFQIEIDDVQREVRQHQLGIHEELRSQDERMRQHQAEMQRSQAEL
jgi:uncharacterized membrane protein (DUF106 family)